MESFFTLRAVVCLTFEVDFLDVSIQLTPSEIVLVTAITLDGVTTMYRPLVISQHVHAFKSFSTDVTLFVHQSFFLRRKFQIGSDHCMILFDVPRHVLTQYLSLALLTLLVITFLGLHVPPVFQPPVLYVIGVVQEFLFTLVT